jgi:hypothetical protein
MDDMKKAIFPAILTIVMIASVSLSAETKAPIEGFGGLKWGISIAEARKGLKGKVVYDDEKRMIVTRDGEITYRYGFFFKKKEDVKEGAGKQPQPKKEEAAAKPDDTAAAQPDKPKEETPKETLPVTAEDDTEGETKLFYVVSEFPYIALEDIRKKMTEQYGDSTGDTMSKAQGAMLWDTVNGVAIVWVDAYEKKPYCRRITYVSKTIVKELNSYQTVVFNKRELEVIKTLVR